MSEREESISKRQLGIGLAILGAVGFLAILSIDLLDVGREGGIGPAQSLALLLMAALYAGRHFTDSAGRRAGMTRKDAPASTRRCFWPL